MNKRKIRRFVNRFRFVIALVVVLFGMGAMYIFAAKTHPVLQRVESVVTPTATPSATLTPTETPVQRPSVLPATQHIITLVNRERAAAGLSPVSEIAVLDGSAEMKALDLSQSGNFSHTDSKGRWFTGFIIDAGWSGTAAENLAKNYATDEETVAAWMASPEHRKNVLQPNAIYAGYAQVGIYRVMHFGGFH